MFNSYLEIIRQRNFFLLLLGQIIAQFGDKLTQIALIGLVSQISTSSSSLAFTISMTIVPVLVFSPISGVYVDRWGKKKTMYISDLLRGASILLIALLYVHFPFLPLIYFVIFISFSIGRFFIPAKMAFLPRIVDKEHIFLANSLISMTATVASILGIGVGGIIVESYGVSNVFLINAATFFLSGICIISIVINETSSFAPEDIINLGKAVTDKVKKTFTQELKEGVRYIYTSEETKYAFTIFFFLFAMVGGLFPVLTKFIQSVLGSYTMDLGLVGVSLGLGIFLGSLLYGRIAHSFPVKKVLNFSLLTGSAYLVMFSIVLLKFSSTILAVLLSLALGLVISPLFVGVSALIQRESQSDLLGRIFSGLEFITHLGLLVSMFIFAYLADIFSPFTIIVSIGIIGVLFSLILIKNDTYRRLQRASA